MRATARSTGPSGRSTVAVPKRSWTRGLAAERLDQRQRRRRRRPGRGSPTRPRRAARRARRRRPGTRPRPARAGRVARPPRTRAAPRSSRRGRRRLSRARCHGQICGRPRTRFPTMTPFADARAPEDLGRVARPACACAIDRGGQPDRRLSAPASIAYVVLKRDSDVSCPPPVHARGRARRSRRATPSRSRRSTGRSTATTTQRTRYLPTKRVKPPYDASEWSFQAGKLLEFPPVVAKGTLYFQDKDALLYALSADKGKVEWKKQIGALGAASPAYSHGVVYAVTLQKAPGRRPGRGARAARQGRQAALALPAARPQRDLADRGRQRRDRRQRVGRHLRARPQDRQARLAGAHRRRRQGRAGARRRRPLRRQLRRPGLRHQGLERRSTCGSRAPRGSSFGRGGPVYSTPAVAYGRVFLGIIDSRVYSFDQDNGELAVEPLHRRLGLRGARGRRHAEDRPDRLRRLQGPELLRARREDRRGALAEAHRRRHPRRRHACSARSSTSPASGRTSAPSAST